MKRAAHDPHPPALRHLPEPADDHFAAGQQLLDVVRPALEQLWRYITRPALANEPVQRNSAGQVVLKPKTPWRDGTTLLVLSPLEFMQRLARLVLRRRRRRRRLNV